VGYDFFIIFIPMRILVPLLTFLLLYTFSDFNIWSIGAISIWMIYLVNFLSNLNNSIPFREYVLVMYGLNYLFSAAVQYEITQDIAYYKMKLTPEAYFSMTIPAMFCFHAGLYSIKSKIFSYSFSLSKIQTVLNEKLLKQWLIAGIILGLSKSLFPGDLSFIVYLLSGIKYIAAFGLFIIDKRKYKWYLIGIFVLEVANALQGGMFHDMVIWMIFFGMVWIYVNKPSAAQKFVLITIAIFALFTLQSVKSAYRAQLRSGSGGLGSFSEVVSKKSGGNDGILNLDNLASSLTRSNQGWIFSWSTERMNRVKDFQGPKLLNVYAEAAFLPRFLAPDKLKAGDNEIFNRFSGARIAKTGFTSMGLGLFADGYISYGFNGVLIFAFAFGLLCALVFKIIERWAAISPLFSLFFFPLLNYAVRADCETQTWMGHIVKGLIVFSILMYFTRRWFRLRESKMEEEQIETTSAKDAQLIPSTA